MTQPWFAVIRCLATAVSPPLQPRQKYNMSDAIRVGSCDRGPLEFDIVYGKTGIEVRVS